MTDCIDIVVRVIDFVLALLLNFNVYGERGERDQIGVSLILYLFCVSLKKDVDLHLPLYMDALFIAEAEVLKVFSIHFDQKLIWNQMIDQLATHSRQRLGAIYIVKDYLGECGLTIAFKSFIRPVCEYGNIIFMGASATHLHKLDLVQKMAKKITFSSLASRRNTSTIGLLCKLLDLQC